MNSSFPSEAQRMITQMLNLRTQAQSCTGCQSMEAIQGWINRFANEDVKNYYQQLKPSNSVITNLETPGIPYAVIWGNEDHEDALTLTRLVTSWENAGVSGDDEAYIDCFNSIIEQRIQEANQQFALGLMQSIAQLAGAAGKIFTTNPNPGEAIEKAINAAVTALRSMFNLQKEIQEVAECELVHQAMNAQWNLMLAPYETHTGYLDVPCLPCEQCESEEDPQVAGWCWSNCMYGCDPLTQSFQEPYTFITFQPHDGLLLKTEQLLAGAAKTYEAKGVNHMQEQFWEYAPIGNAFQDLFNGGAGAAFIVPK
ncbi:MAG: hypothetical protein EPO28_07480 [Saprospiraceae bacterium]|nr:MAG: hypothetical protein EPO28_07480 [Saprospiraceae bacterium]